MFCKKCRFQVDSDSLFCINCGEQISSNPKIELPKDATDKHFFNNIKFYVFILFLIISITCTWHYANFVKWVHVPVEGDPYRSFYYERKLFFPQDYIQSSKILINLNDRSNLNEASYILDENYDCLTNRGKTIKSTSYFKKFGEGEILHTKDYFGYLGPGIAAVTKELCRLGLSNISAQPNRPVSLIELGFHLPTFLDCKDKFFLENRLKLMQYVNPYKKMDDYWIYETTSFVSNNFGNYARLPVKQLWLGVCDKEGSLGCGKSSLIALMIDMPINQVKGHLLTHRKLGYDFTIENRDLESKVTMTAHLIQNPNNVNNSMLYCDSGNL